MYACRPGPERVPPSRGQEEDRVTPGFGTSKPGCGSHFCHLVALSHPRSLGLVCSVVKKREDLTRWSVTLFLLSFVADSHLVPGLEGLCPRDSHPACSNYLLGQSLLKGVKYTEHSYLQMIKHLIRTNFSKMWDVLGGSQYIAHRTEEIAEKLRMLNPGPPVWSRFSLCCFPPSVDFILLSPSCLLSEEGAMLTSFGIMKSGNGSSSVFN